MRTLRIFLAISGLTSSACLDGPWSTISVGHPENSSRTSDGGVLTVIDPVFCDGETPFCYRAPTDWADRVRVVVRASRRLAAPTYRIFDLELRHDDGLWVSHMRFFLTKNLQHDTLPVWLETNLPGSTSFFRVDPVAVHPTLQGVHLIWTAPVRATQPLNFPFPDTLALEDPAHEWVLFPTLLGDHAWGADFEVDEDGLDPHWWSGVTLDGSPPPEPQLFIAGFGETCSAGYRDLLGAFRLTSVYSNGDCTGLGRGHHTAIEFLRRVYPQTPWAGVVEDFAVQAEAWGWRRFVLGGREPLRVGDVILFQGGREGHVAVAKQVACFPSHVCRVTVIEQNWWGDDVGVGRILTFSERDGNVVAMELASGNHYVTGWLRGDDHHPDMDDDGDGALDLDCDDLDPVTYPRTQESCADRCAPGTGEYAACNGIDDNCDGQTDEEFSDLLGSECVRPGCSYAGVTICDPSGRGRVCAVDAALVTSEVCDGNDNDCDGSVDEGCAPPGVCDECINDQQCLPGLHCMNRGGSAHSYCVAACAQARPLCPPGFFCVAERTAASQLTWYCAPARFCEIPDFP